MLIDVKCGPEGLKRGYECRASGHFNLPTAFVGAGHCCIGSPSLLCASYLAELQSNLGFCAGRTARPISLNDIVAANPFGLRLRQTPKGFAAIKVGSIAGCKGQSSL